MLQPKATASDQEVTYANAYHCPKRDGGELSTAEIERFIRNTWPIFPEYQAAALIGGHSPKRDEPAGDSSI
ncbi:MAG: hypothetical protein H6667_17765 [Ardenticatenaceae bacterium]|nr:hypothetical protein [Ardenticatenaceae bacterium]